jgi:DNA replication protein DnaC
MSLEKLKLIQMKEHLEEVSNFVSQNKLSFSDGLLKLCTYEIDYKSETAAKSMIKAAAFPFVKTIEDYDFEFQPCVEKQDILEIATLRFMENAENIVFLGSSGVGKTHLATAIGIVAASKRYSTYFIKCNNLLQRLKKAKIENRLDSVLKYINRYKLLIIDELGYLPIDKEDSNLFFQLIDMRYEKKSTILTTNINFNDWDNIFYDAVVANAILDRILHHSKVITINGRSYRVKDYIKPSE